jgi:hypothetical protein
VLSQASQDSLLECPRQEASTQRTSRSRTRPAFLAAISLPRSSARRSSSYSREGHVSHRVILAADSKQAGGRKQLHCLVMYITAVKQDQPSIQALLWEPTAEASTQLTSMSWPRVWSAAVLFARSELRSFNRRTSSCAKAASTGQHTSTLRAGCQVDRPRGTLMGDHESRPDGV